MRDRVKPLVVVLVLVLLAPSAALAKKGQGPSPSYGSSGYAGPTGDDAPSYGPPGYAGPKQALGDGPSPDAMPPGQRKKQYGRKFQKPQRHGPPDHAPAWGYRGQQPSPGR